uniref:Uncharacterized protein n=1 Tax=Methylophaga nitratireducenticrescens TaxID=754476 RepID=I1XFR0_METNJ
MQVIFYRQLNRLLCLELHFVIVFFLHPDAIYADNVVNSQSKRNDY